jgi:sec-independent protein translocase protein TatB
MFGIDFPELVVIGVVALIVIGPEHLPKVARTIGHLWGRAQRYVSSVKADMSRDLALDELRKLQQQAQQEVGNIQNAITQASHDVEKQLSEIEAEVTASKYELGQSIPPSELSAKVLPKEELLKSEMPKVNKSESGTPQENMPRHEIIEEHHAVLPVSAEHKKPANS